jgi:pilus assembly protein TadC
MARSVDTTLTLAGRPHGGISGQDYVAAAIILSLLGGLSLGGLQAILRLADGSEPLNALMGAVRVTTVLAPCVFLFMIFGVKSQASRVAIEVEREFPFFLDLAILVVQAGGTPRQALTKFVEASPGTVLSREIAITAKDADATSFADALNRLIDRVSPKSVKTILKNLAQGERSSGEVEQFYTDQAKELRYLREEMANRTAERLKANIAFPVFLMMFAVIIAALAPTIVSIRAQGLF